MSPVKYIAIPADKSATWGDVYDFVEPLGITGNDFIGSRTYRASNGGFAVKFDVE